MPSACTLNPGWGMDLAIQVHTFNWIEPMTFGCIVLTPDHTGQGCTLLTMQGHNSHRFQRLKGEHIGGEETLFSLPHYSCWMEKQYCKDRRTPQIFYKSSFLPINFPLSYFRH